MSNLTSRIAREKILLNLLKTKKNYFFFIAEIKMLMWWKSFFFTYNFSSLFYKNYISFYSTVTTAYIRSPIVSDATTHASSSVLSMGKKNS